MRALMPLLQLALAILVVTAVVAGVDVAAAAPTVPEIEGSTLTAGLGLLAAAVVMLRSRVRKR